MRACARPITIADAGSLKKCSNRASGRGRRPRRPVSPAGCRGRRPRRPGSPAGCRGRRPRRPACRHGRFGKTLPSARASPVVGDGVHDVPVPPQGVGDGVHDVPRRPVSPRGVGRRPVRGFPRRPASLQTKKRRNAAFFVGNLRD